MQKIYSFSFSNILVSHDLWQILLKEIRCSHSALQGLCWQLHQQHLLAPTRSRCPHIGLPAHPATATCRRSGEEREAWVWCAHPKHITKVTRGFQHQISACCSLCRSGDGRYAFTLYSSVFCSRWRPALPEFATSYSSSSIMWILKPHYIQRGRHSEEVKNRPCPHYSLPLFPFTEYNCIPRHTPAPAPLRPAAYLTSNSPHANFFVDCHAGFYSFNSFKWWKGGLFLLFGVHLWCWMHVYI